MKLPTEIYGLFFYVLNEGSELIQLFYNKKEAIKAAKIYTKQEEEHSFLKTKYIEIDNSDTEICFQRKDSYTYIEVKKLGIK